MRLKLIGVLAVLWVGIETHDKLGFIGVAALILFFGGAFYLAGRGENERTTKLRKRRTTVSSRRGPCEFTKTPVTRMSAVMTASSAQDIETALNRLPVSIRNRSGSVFYTGQDAFTGERSLYLLGLNPGGNPVEQSANTVQRHIDEFRTRHTAWSAYADDSWEGAAPGSRGIQPRVLHMLGLLELEPRLTPASNVVFVRTRNEAELKTEASRLIRDCWPVHQAVIDVLKVRAVVCFGGTAGSWVRQQLGANELYDQFTETNSRGWRSTAHRAHDGKIVITTSHPGRADWRNPSADPTPLIQRALAQATL